MQADPHIWIFTNGMTQFPGGVFTTRELAEDWISKHKLTGTLTAYPVDEGCFDWAMRHGVVGMKPEKLEVKKDDPQFIGGFSTASQDHHHYEDGKFCV